VFNSRPGGSLTHAGRGRPWGRLRHALTGSNAGVECGGGWTQHAHLARRAGIGSTRVATAGSLAAVVAGAAVCGGAGSSCELVGVGAAGFSARTAGASRRTTCEGVGGTGSGS